LNNKLPRKKTIDLGVFEELEPFHWKVDFGWIIENGGFDVVIGNPPYGGNLREIEKLLNDPNNITSKRNIAKVFILRGFQLAKDGGYISLIVPKSLTYASDWEGVRKFLLDPLKELYDVKEAFKDVLLEQVIFVAKKNAKFEIYKTRDLFRSKNSIDIPKDSLPVDTFYWTKESFGFSFPELF